MNTLFVINAAHIHEFATQPFAGGGSAYDRVQSFARHIAGESVFVFGAEQPQTDMAALMRCLASRLKDGERPDMIIYAHADCPFLDEELTWRLIDIHTRYHAEYTFADGYPPGFAPEILSAAVIPNLAELAARYAISSDRKGLFELIQKDINSFDIETYLAPRDLRAYRFEPVCDCKRNYMAAERLAALGGDSAESVIRILPAHTELLRTVPAFFWVQLVSACPQACSYCPYPRMAGDPRALSDYMPPERFNAILHQASALSDEFVIDVSLWGELSMYPHMQEIADMMNLYPRATLLVETSGIGWKRGAAERLAAEAGSRIAWVISLDAADEALYAELRGEGMPEAVDFARRMIEASPETVHVQAVRMMRNEENLETFYRSWKKLTNNVIIQKYDRFCSCLPDASVADVSPLERLPCRHLARDMSILLDGTVVPCKHCLAGNASLRYAETLGNVFNGGLAAAWDAMSDWYTKHISGNYPAPCGMCDEYYTFNA